MNLNKIGFQNTVQAPTLPKAPDSQKSQTQARFTPTNNQWFSKSAFTYNFPQYFNMPNIPQMAVSPSAYPAIPPVSTTQAGKDSKTVDILDEIVSNLGTVSSSSKVEKTEKTSAVGVANTNDNFVWKNDLRKLFNQNKAVIYAMIPRTFNAQDKDGDELIDRSKGEIPGTFMNAIERFPEIKKYGINTFHVLPINLLGEQGKLGNASSLYAAKNLLKVDPNLYDSKHADILSSEELDKSIKHISEYISGTPEELKTQALTRAQAKKHNNEAHKAGFSMMLDLPSCLSLDNEHKEVEAKTLKPKVDANGKPVLDENGKPVTEEIPKVPQGWEDIKAMESFSDEEKRALKPETLDLHLKYIDFIAKGLNYDGIRADVARFKPPEFWSVFSNYLRGQGPFEYLKYAKSDPEKAKQMLAELEVKVEKNADKDNIMRFIKESKYLKQVNDKLKAGTLDIPERDPQFALLGENYIYEDATPMANIPADRPEDVLKAGFDAIYGQYHIFHQLKTAKEFHDYVISNLEMSQKLPPNKSLIGSFVTHDDKSPMCNGGATYCNLTSGLQATLPMVNPYFVTGFETGDWYNYSYKVNKKLHLNTDWIDIFNNSRKPGGKNPEIGEYMTGMLSGNRNKFEDIITKGSYGALKVEKNKDDLIISYVRNLNGKTILAIGNKDTNAIQSGKIMIPTLKANQVLKDLAPPNGAKDNISAEDGAITVNLAPNAFHLFEIDTPDIGQHVKMYKQNLDTNFDYEKGVFNESKEPIGKTMNDPKITSENLNDIYKQFSSINAK